MKRKSFFLLTLLAVTGFDALCNQDVMMIYYGINLPVSSTAFRQAPPPHKDVPQLPPHQPAYLPPREIEVGIPYAKCHLLRRNRCIKHQQIGYLPPLQRVKQRFVPPTPTGRKPSEQI